MTARMILRFALLLAGCGPLCAFGQPGWTGAGVLLSTTQMKDIAVDTVADALYFCGESLWDANDPLQGIGISAYVNGQWDTLGSFNGRVNGIVRYQDTLVACGEFNRTENDPSAQYIAYNAGAGWYNYGTFMSSGIEDLKVIDGVLYAIGAFSHADGVLCNGLAKRVGGQWTNIGTMDVGSSPYIGDLLEWNDTLYATGSISFNGTTADHIAWFDGTEWHPLGTGITGGFGQGRSLCVYEDELYVGGSIYISQGNVGHGIMKWNGSQFSPVGTGLKGSCGTYGCAAGATDMKVHNGLLFVSGAFRYAGEQPTTHIATWDGSQWCGMPGDLRGPVDAIEFFHDTLFAGPFHEAEGIDVNCGAKFIGASYFTTCSGPMVVVGPQTISGLTVSQVAGNAWSITGLPPNEHEVAILDLSGRVIHAQQVRATGYGSATVEFHALGTGIYIMRAGVQSVRFFAP